MYLGDAGRAAELQVLDGDGAEVNTAEIGPEDIIRVPLPRETAEVEGLSSPESSELIQQQSAHDVASPPALMCSVDDAVDADSARDAAIAEAVVAMPALDDVDRALEREACDHVKSAAGAAFDACLAVAMLRDPLGECVEPSLVVDEIVDECIEPSEERSAGECIEVSSPIEAPAQVVQEAEIMYTEGPGIAVLKFAAVLNNVSGICPTGEGAIAYTGAQVIEALTQYDAIISRSLQAYSVQTNPNITLASRHVSGKEDGARADENIQDLIEGCDIERSAYGNAPGGRVSLSDDVLGALASLGSEFTFRISEIAGGEHSESSRHYAGVAIDVDMIDGSTANAANPSQARFRRRCRELGATEVLGPGCSGHDTHVHAAWPRP